MRVILSGEKNLSLKPKRFFTPLRSVQNDKGILLPRISIKKIRGS